MSGDSPSHNDMSTDLDIIPSRIPYTSKHRCPFHTSGETIPTRKYRYIQEPRSALYLIYSTLADCSLLHEMVLGIDGEQDTGKDNGRHAAAEQFDTSPETL